MSTLRASQRTSTCVWLTADRRALTTIHKQIENEKQSRFRDNTSEQATVMLNSSEMDRFDCVVWQDREVKFDIVNV